MKGGSWAIVMFLVVATTQARATGFAWKNEELLRETSAVGAARFGQSIVIDASTMLVTWFDQDGQYVRVFELSSDQWTAVQDVTPVGGQVFRHRIALAGELMAVAGDGVAYVFERNSGTWQYLTDLEPVERPGLGGFGFVSLALDADVIVAGHSNATVGGRSSAGLVHLFEWAAGAWTQTELFPADSEPGAEFGHDVALEGGVLVIGSPCSDTTGGVNSGAVYVFRRIAAGWVQEAKLSPSDAGPLDRFGTAVDLEGDLIIVGSPRDIHSGYIEAGSCYVFRHTEVGWVEESKLVEEVPRDLAQFGTQVSVSQNFAAATSIGAGYLGIPGLTHVFRREDSGWRTEGVLSGADPNESGDYGTFPVGFNGSYLAVSDSQLSASGSFIPGGVFLYKRGQDCDRNRGVDEDEIQAMPWLDCDQNGVLDSCDIDPNDPDGDGLTTADCDANGVPDSCDVDPGDPDQDGLVSEDCNENSVPDTCDISPTGSSADVNGNLVPDECDCIGDLSGDGVVGLDDLAEVIAGFGCGGGECDGDVDEDGDTDLSDLAILIGNFGATCP